MKKVSVIVTTYNSEKSIQRLLNSINSQIGLKSIFNIELIVVDDCSTDNTTQILEFNEVKFISTNVNSGGPNKGRNIGLNIATGDYICIADHDDEWNEYKLILMLPLMEIAPVVTSGYTVFDSNTGKSDLRIHKPINDTEYIFYKENLTFLSKLSKSNNGQIAYLGSILFSSELKKIKFEEVYGQLDFDWVLKLFENRTSIEICKSLYKRHVEGENLSMNEKYRLRDFEFSLSFIKQYAISYPKEIRIAHQKLHGSLARYYYVVNNMKKARQLFLKSGLNLKTILYFLTTFVGAKFVKKHFNVFG